MTHHQARCRRPRIEESNRSGGVARLGLVGELDTAVVEQLLTRVGLLLASGTRVRIDLSRLTFIDTRGSLRCFGQLIWDARRATGSLSSIRSSAQTFDMIGADGRRSP